jgi:hypothetical protein
MYFIHNRGMGQRSTKNVTNPKNPVCKVRGCKNRCDEDFRNEQGTKIYWRDYCKDHIEMSSESRMTASAEERDAQERPWAY